MDYNSTYFAPDCPVCGKEGGATNCGGQGHSVSVCSDRCNKRYALWMRMGKVTKTSDLNPFEHQDDDEILVMIHERNQYGESPFNSEILSKSKIALRTEIKNLKRRGRNRALSTPNKDARQ